MATIQQLESALIKADAAGNEADARALAAEIRKLRSPQAAPVAGPTLAARAKQELGNVAAGAVRGAGSIGATLLTPLDAAARAVGVQNDIIGRTDRRESMTATLADLGADTESLAFSAGKLGAEIAGTAGVGGAIAKAASAVPGVAAAAPNVLQAIRASGMGGGNALARATGGAIAGGASAGLVNPDDALTGAAVGGALPVAIQAAGKVGSVVGAGARKAVKAAIGQASPEVAALAKRAQELGIDVPADRLLNSKPVNAVAASLNYVPFSGRAGTEEKMVTQLNSALSRTFGQTSDNVTQSLRKASKDLGGEFDRVLKSNTVNVDKTFIQELAEAGNRANAELGSDGASIINKQIDDIVSKAAAGEIDGQAAYNIKKTLDRIGGRNTPEAFYARDLKKSLMGALDRSLGADEAKAFATTRKQYGNMLDIEGIAQNGAEGGVSVARLANMKNINNQDLQELADISAQFLRTRESPHGALQRLVIGGAASTAAGMGALPYVAAAGVGGRATNSVLNSKTARSLALNEPIPNALSRLADPRLQELAYRSAPVLAGDR